MYCYNNYYNQPKCSLLLKRTGRLIQKSNMSNHVTSQKIWTTEKDNFTILILLNTFLVRIGNAERVLIKLTAEVLEGFVMMFDLYETCCMETNITISDRGACAACGSTLLPMMGTSKHMY